MIRRNLCMLALYATAACTATASVQSADETSPSWDEALGAEITDDWRGDEHRSFDFWIGEWAANWRSRQEGAFHFEKEGSWTRQRVFPILGGKALVELAWARDNPDEASQRGFSIRYFDPSRKRWVMAQNWPGPNSQGSAFTDQLIGDEHLGRLSMYSVAKRRTKEGEIVSEHRRYNFTDIRPGVSFRWDGSNTPDRGATWFTWNVVDFLHQSSLDPYASAGTSFPGVHEESLCTEEPHGAFDGLAGAWTGDATAADGTRAPAHFYAGKALDGCAVLGVIEENGAKTFIAIGFHPRFEKWVIYQLDDTPGTTHRYFVSGAGGERAEFVEAADLAIKHEFTAYNEPASYEPEGALRRLVWDVTGGEEIELRMQARETSAADWSTEKHFRLRRR